MVREAPEFEQSPKTGQLLWPHWQAAGKPDHIPSATLPPAGLSSVYCAPFEQRTFTVHTSLIRRWLRIGLALTSLPAAVCPAFATADQVALQIDDLPPPFELLGEAVAPATRALATWQATENYAGVPVTTPVIVVHGAEPGPVLCLTAAIHGDELNGVEIVRQTLAAVDPEQLTGTIVGVPIANLPAFNNHSRYLPDRRDLNRFFPGNQAGSAAARIAHGLFEAVVQHCETLVDLHTASFRRTNLPQLRADLSHERVHQLTTELTGVVVLHSVGVPGTLRRAAIEQGITALTLEAGGPNRVEPEAVEEGLRTVHQIMTTMAMLPAGPGTDSDGVPQASTGATGATVFFESRWIRANQGGLLSTAAVLGMDVKRGDVLGTITDPITNERASVVAPFDGRVLGMAVNQLVMPGYATFHLGVAPTRPSEAPALPAAE